LRALLILFIAGGASAAPVKLKVEAGDIDRQNSPMIARLAIGREIAADQAKSLAENPLATLTAANGTPILAQVESTGHWLHVRWIEPKLKAHEAREYDLASKSGSATGDQFHFVDCDGYRDLMFGEQGVYRYMDKYDPADRGNTF